MDSVFLDLHTCFAQVEVQNMRGDSGIILRRIDVFHYEDAVESGQDCVVELDLLSDLLEFTEGSKHGVGSSKH